MAFRDYALVPTANTVLADGTYVGPNMLRNKVRPAVQQIMVDGKLLANDVAAAEANATAAVATANGIAATASSAVSTANGAHANSVAATNTANGASVNAIAALNTANNALAVANNTSPTSANFTAAGAGAVGRTISSKLGDTVNVKDFGATGDGVTDDTAKVTAADAATTGAVAFTPGTYLLSTTPTVSGPLEIYPGASLTGAGATGVAYTNAAVRQSIYTAAPNEVASRYIRRNTSYTGGTAGFTSSALRCDTYVGAGNANFEWTATFLMDNSATGGENVAMYAVGIKRSTGPTWGAVIEVKDRNGANPTSGAVGLELDVSANGTDNNTARIGIDIAIRKDDPAGAECVASFGTRIQHGGYPNTLVKIGYGFDSGMRTETAFDASTATCLLGAFKMKEGQHFVFSADNTKTMTHTGGAWSFNISGVSKASIADSGAISVGANQVLGSRGAAVADATDAASVITQFNLLLARLRAPTGHGIIA